ncbi:MAG: outer membrane protein assembly factor BamD [Chthoniobacteraceae bacterium]
MVQRLALLLAAGFIALGAVSCKKSPKDAIAEKQAKFRADQKARALKQYQDLVKKYPESEFAEKAKERIRALATPAPAKK